MADENPIERDVKAAEGIFQRHMEVLERAVGQVAPVGKRLLTRREKLMRSFATPARTWTPQQQEFVLKEMLRMKDGGKP